MPRKNISVSVNLKYRTKVWNIVNFCGKIADKRLKNNNTFDFLGSRVRKTEHFDFGHTEKQISFAIKINIIQISRCRSRLPSKLFCFFYYYFIVVN